jgi:hypothetical protein
MPAARLTFAVSRKKGCVALQERLTLFHALQERLVWADQVTPPSVVLRMTPFSPTTQPVVVLIKKILSKLLVVPLVSSALVKLPALEVLIMVSH